MQGFSPGALQEANRFEGFDDRFSGLAALAFGLLPQSNNANRQRHQRAMFTQTKFERTATQISKQSFRILLAIDHAKRGVARLFFA